MKQNKTKRFLFLILILLAGVILFFNKPAYADNNNLSLELAKIGYDIPIIRLKVIIKNINMQPYHSIVLMKNNKEIEKNILNINNDINDMVKDLEDPAITTAPQKSELYFWVWNAEQSSIFQVKAYSKDDKLLGESELLNIDINDFIPPVPLLSLKQNQIIGNKISCDVDEKTTEIKLLVNNESFFSLNTNNVKKHISFDLKIPSGENQIQFITKNIWGERQSEVFTVVNTVEEVPYSNFIFITKSNFHLYFIKDNLIQASFPIAIGTPATPTPTGYFIIGKKENMSIYSGWGILRMLIYRKTANGLHWSGYAIHGTNNPGSIGKEASHGCVRMYNKDVVNLSKQVPIGTWVLIKN